MEVTFDTIPSTECVEICILNDDILEAREELRVRLSQALVGENIVIATENVPVVIEDTSGEKLSLPPTDYI